MNEDTSTPFATVALVALAIVVVGGVWGWMHCSKLGFFMFCT